MHVKTGFGCVLAIAASIGCGGGSGGTFMTSVPPSTPLNSLTPAQSTQICNDFAAYATNTLQPDVCRADAVETAAGLLSSQPAPTDAQLQAACTEEYNACVGGGDGGLGFSGLMCDASSGIPATCTATVGDLESCFNGLQAQSNAILATLPTCSTITMANLVAASGKLAGEEDAGMSEPASCAQIESPACGTGTTVTSSSLGAIIARMQRR